MTGLTSTPVVLADAGEGGGRIRKWCETVETSAADSTTSTYLMGRFNSSDRLFGSSYISHDALGAATATLDVGLFNTGTVTYFTNSATAINTGIVASTAGDKRLIADRANWGKRLWELAGLTADPKCQMDVKVTLSTANLSSGAGTITIEADFASD